MRSLKSSILPVARWTAPLAALLFILTAGAARAQFPPLTAPSGAAVTARVTSGGPFVIFAGTGQGQQLVTDQQTISQFGQFLAGTQFALQEQTRNNGLGMGSLTISRGGQPVLSPPATYFDPNSDQTDVFFHYSNPKTILNGRLFRDPQDRSQGSAEVFLTIIGSDGTPLSGFITVDLAFSQ